MAATASLGSTTTAESSSGFSRDLYENIITPGQKDNVVFSPASIQTCVALAYFGAKGNTESEISSGLHLGTSDKDVVAKRFSNLLTSSKSSTQLAIANKIYVNKELHVKKDFNSIAKEAFQSEAESVDFTENNKVVQKINSWVESKTNNNIKDLLSSVAPETSMILVNAVHLKATWKFKFSSYSTHKSDFWITPDTSVKVDTMSNADYGYKYAQWSDLDATALGMPYSDSDLEMVIVLPNKKDGLAALENKLKSADILNLANQMKTYDVDVYLPKFKVESKFKLNDALSKMGMATMFSDNADFSNLFEEKTPVKVSEVVHKAFINVDEEGTEASAATYMKIVPMSLNLDQKLFKADHPFLYFIKNQEYIYFMGRVASF
ncbi:serine protease inhibitor 42Dd-like isoform X2 [Condylostylus longicornis]|nr:serine protease inhibitor 42Dd-like isoform X2 [Condylostylus longicornis]XP_055379641.1 serine protease inhibitor 42Dd-like isoform X2 [Condylostylus longicornis]